MTSAPVLEPARGQALPEIEHDVQSTASRILIGIFTLVPLVALLVAVTFAWGWALGWTDIALTMVFYTVSAAGITVGYHRYFTHGSFKANRPLRIALALAGSLAIGGPVITWVADHRRHHKYSDKEGDPHSPWRFGTGWKALTKGLFWAHYGWLFDGTRTSKQKFTPDLLADRDIVRIQRLFPAMVAVSLVLPAVLGGLLTMSWTGAITAFFWASLVRVSLLQHVTWSINSICHTFGLEQFEVRDKSRNVWWLAIPSLGESWHNLHHAEPTSARHGVLKGQLDISARIIWSFEKLGWATDVRWPSPERLVSRRIT